MNSIKVFWVLSGNQGDAGARLQGYQVHDFFIKQGINSTISEVDFNKNIKSYSLRFLNVARRILKQKPDLAIFHKPEWMMFKLSEMARSNNIKTLAVQCDPLPGEYEKSFDSIIVPTPGLKKALHCSNAAIIDDMTEVPSTVFKSNYHRASDKLRIVWVGHPGWESYLLSFLSKLKSEYSNFNSLEFVIISKGNWATHQWSPDTVYDQICNSDLAILPVPQDDRTDMKSSNRLTMLMALGLPTICSPIPAYSAIIQQEINGFVAYNTQDFIIAIEKCRDNAMRQKIGTNARIYARNNYDPSIIGPKWIEVVRNTLDLPSPTLSNKSSNFLHIMAKVLLRI